MEQGASASVPQIWPLEVGNVLLKAQVRRLVNEAQGSAFVGLLQDRLIKTDMQTQTHALSDTLHPARRFGLSTCDACYPKLALRENVKLATLERFHPDLEKSVRSKPLAVIPAKAGIQQQ